MKKRNKTKYIVIHCSATDVNFNGGASDIRKWHKDRGWFDIGYHLVVTRCGVLETGRDLTTVGAHVKGYNNLSVGVCLIGGKAVNSNKGEMNFTDKQFTTLKATLKVLKATYPKAKIVGHRDLSPDFNGDGRVTKDEWLKECPCFEAKNLN